MKYGWILLFSLALACSPKEPSPVRTVLSYLPLQKGTFQIYSVDSVVVDQNIETAFHYELKTTVRDSFPNQEGGFTYVIQRLKRSLSTDPWKAQESWSVRANSYQAVVNEGNVPYLKLASPLVNGKSWDGNSLNTKGGSEKCLDTNNYTCDIYTLQEVDEGFDVSTSESFPTTVTVVQSDNRDLIVASDIRTEIYALGVGLVERDISKLTYCTNSDCVGQQFVVEGLKYRQIISEYGQE